MNHNSTLKETTLQYTLALIRLLHHALSRAITPAEEAEMRGFLGGLYSVAYRDGAKYERDTAREEIFNSLVIATNAEAIQHVSALMKELCILLDDPSNETRKLFRRALLSAFYRGEEYAASRLPGATVIPQGGIFANVPKPKRLLDTSPESEKITDTARTMLNESITQLSELTGKREFDYQSRFYHALLQMYRQGALDEIAYQDAVRDELDFDMPVIASYAGGAAPEGLYGRVVLRVGGKYVDYVPASSLNEPDDSTVDYRELQAREDGEENTEQAARRWIATWCMGQKLEPVAMTALTRLINKRQDRFYKDGIEYAKTQMRYRLGLETKDEKSC